MESNNANVVTDVKTSNGKKENLTFPVMNAKREAIDYIHPDEAKNPLQMIGKLINTYASKLLIFVNFPANKSKVFVIPAAGTYGTKERALMALKNYLAAITEGMERNEAITDKDTLQKLGLFTAKGWKFTTFTKTGLLTVASAKLAEVTTAVALVKEITLACPDLKRTLANNDLRKKITAEVKTKGIAAGLALAKENSFKALPTIIS